MSTGREPYSIAILLNEHFHDLLKSWKVRIVATDISNIVLNRGREGIYSELEIVRGPQRHFSLSFIRSKAIEYCSVMSAFCGISSTESQ